MPNLKVAIIDYQLSNLFSVLNACKFVGLDAKITSDPKDLILANALILPGVGAFGDAMDNLQKLKLIDPIKSSIKNGKPFFGVCLGLQLLFESSNEFGLHKGLGVIKGKVVKFENRTREGETVRVPQIGWNKIEINNLTNPYFKDVRNNEFMYFVHSYYVLPTDNKVNAAFTTYETTRYTSAILLNNIFAVQFHPERSGPQGLKIYRNFSKIITKTIK